MEVGANNKVAGKDTLAEIYNLAIIDSFHPADPEGNERLYRYQKANVVWKFIERIGDKQKVFLDAGAGRGPYTYFASSKFKTVYCFEFDAEELDGAKKNIGLLPNIQYQQVDLRNIPLPDCSVDAMVCSEVLEHIPKESKAAKELYRVLKPGGRLLFSMPNNNSMFYRRVSATSKIKELKKIDLSALPHGDWEAVRHVSFSPKEIEQILVNAGFSIKTRIGANIISVPGTVRRILLRGPKFILQGFLLLQEMLAKPLAKYGAFYFIEAVK